jgi:hypothetical protein
MNGRGRRGLVGVRRSRHAAICRTDRLHGPDARPCRRRSHVTRALKAFSPGAGDR